jgi:hypothetical protein
MFETSILLAVPEAEPLHEKTLRTSPYHKSGTGDPVITFIPCFSLGEEYRFEDHHPSPFCVANANPRQETFQLARALKKKGGQQYFSRDARVLFESNPFPLKWEPSTKKGGKYPLSSDWFLEGGSGAVVLVEYLALVYAHDPVESDYEE